MRDHFFVRNGSEYRKIKLSTILYLEADLNLVYLITQDQKIEIRATMKKIMTMLPADSFCRIHRSFVVPVERVISFDRLSATLEDARGKKIVLPVSRLQHYDNLEKKIWVLGDLIGVKKLI